MSETSPVPDADLASQHYDEALDRLADGNLDAAIAAFRASLAIDPDFRDAMHGLIRALQDRGDLDEAIAAAMHLISLDPDDVLPHTSLSMLYQRKGMVPEAEAEAQKAKLLGWKAHLRQRDPA